MASRKQLAKQISRQIPGLDLSDTKARNAMADQLISAGIKAKMHVTPNVDGVDGLLT